MPGEHLAIFNYDDQSEADIVTKLGILAERGSVDTQSIREYEEQNYDGGRETVLAALDQIDGTEAGGTVTANEPEPQAESQPGATAKSGGAKGGS